MVDYGLTVQISEALVDPGYGEGEGFVYATEAAIDEERLPEYIEVWNDRTNPNRTLIGRYRLRLNDDYPGPTVYEDRRTGNRVEVIF